MKFLLLIVTMLSFNNCNKDSSTIQVYLYEKGIKIRLSESKLDIPLVNTLLNQLLENTNEYMRLYMDGERFESLKHEEVAAEFIFQHEMKVTSLLLGELKFRRILIPLTGDFAGNDKSSNMTLFIGNNDYFPEPISNETGYSFLLKLIAELEKARI